MGAWIEIYSMLLICMQASMSHPTMGAWIEIDEFSELDLVHIRRTPRWVRGLKSVM